MLISINLNIYNCLIFILPKLFAILFLNILKIFSKSNNQYVIEKNQLKMSKIKTTYFIGFTYFNFLVTSSNIIQFF